ncbi:hydrogenase maturation nickel metallochaperone HypA [Thiohalobacter sp. IOR34]|uniref:hydrogenase maturation nickel metallochaperone HypA n=1 Tax=Thiohalobacter sp. IOR34 TaxID=3057176 RepID=UPI0025B1D819|nr:hydrogenase maturation nickel metallochaperone HypA [Thiohalobacter sp. IOR34]WJW76389.1 hydrogenase maturation nickel metallochaperone HypA [Thiohalobacter sp. IOR34]
MHEMALCESVLQLLEENARLQGFSRVRRLWLEVGCLAGVESEALRFSFEVLSRGTLAEDAVLEIVEQPGQAWCETCAARVDLRGRLDACPRCGGYRLQVSGGDALRIRELEVV